MTEKINRAVAITQIEGLLEAEKYNEAEHLLDVALEAGIKEPGLYHLKGLLYSFRRGYENARKWIAKAIEGGGTHWLYLKNLGVMNYHLGNIEESVDNFTRTIKAAPYDYETYGFLSDAQKFRERPALLDTIEALLKNKRLNNLQRANLHFAAGKIYDDIGEPDSAFPHFASGNKAAGRLVNMDLVEQKAKDLKRVYSPSYLERATQKGIKGVSPVFVVGMPRSGTSLMEQIITSHPRGIGVGEIPDIRQIQDRLDRMLAKGGGYPLGLPQAKGAFRIDLGKSYLDKLTLLTGNNDPTKRIVDKSPLNFGRMGLIAELFPDARIIHMRRDPRDTCLSCYFTNFLSNQNFSFDLLNLARFYKLYRRLMKHWSQVMPERFITVDYEELVRDNVGQSRRVIEYLGLDWDDACASPHKSKNLMQSASARQVRQPVYTSSIKRWERYEKHLQPLMEVLYPSREL
jgi:tetratricopeptide (TPR) repeat protein